MPWKNFLLIESLFFGTKPFVLDEHLYIISAFVEERRGDERERREERREERRGEERRRV